MFSFHKRLFIFLAFLQIISVHVVAVAQTNSRFAYVCALTGAGLAKELNNELNFTQEQAYKERKFFELVEINVPNRGSCGYILYNLFDRMGETNSFITQVAYVYSLAEAFLGTAIQDEINSLQDIASKENKHLNIVDIKINPERKRGYIIYEISK